MQLLEMEIEISVVVKKPRMEFVDEMSGLLDASTLYSLTNQNTIVKSVQWHGRFDSGFELEFFGSLFEPLCQTE